MREIIFTDNGIIALVTEGDGFRIPVDGGDALPSRQAAERWLAKTYPEWSRGIVWKEISLPGIRRFSDLAEEIREGRA